MPYMVATRPDGRVVWFRPGEPISYDCTNIRVALPEVVAAVMRMMEENQSALHISDDAVRQMNEAMEGVP